MIQLNKFFYFILINTLCQMAADLPRNEYCRPSHLLKRIGYSALGGACSSLTSMWIAQNSTMEKNMKIVATIASSVLPNLLIWQFCNQDPINREPIKKIWKYILLCGYTVSNKAIVSKHNSDDKEGCTNDNLFKLALGYLLVVSRDHYNSYREVLQEQQAARLDLPRNESISLSDLMNSVLGVACSCLISMLIAQNSTMEKNMKIVATIASSVLPSLLIWQFFNQDPIKKIWQYILLGFYTAYNAWILHRHNSDDAQWITNKKLLGVALLYVIWFIKDDCDSYLEEQKKK